MTPEASTVMHVRCPDHLPEDTYRQLLELLTELAPLVRALPPQAALIELGAPPHQHGADDACGLGETLRIRTISRLGVDVRVGIGPSVAAAASASAQIPRPGGVLAVSPAKVTDWSAPLPASATVTHVFPRHTPGGAEVRAALLDLVSRLGHQLRHRHQAPGALTLALRFPDGPAWTTSRRPARPSAHHDDLRSTAYRLLDAAGPRRARLTAITLHADDLLDAVGTPVQLALGPSREARPTTEETTGRARTGGQATPFRHAS
ncbi:hypothetical protein [Streptomyces sp. NPDC006997]|uniref:DinB/UmuC family translesion DNA polymerase n=1 Tax=Streptomyces sp. NPDC006997 TaxID=3155356 RepID=UPI0034070F25